jgi:hypothetical protein
MEWQCAIEWAEEFGTWCCTHCAPHMVDAACVMSSRSNNTGRRVFTVTVLRNGMLEVTTDLEYAGSAQPV